ncbi:MAG: hypothetical protein EP330_20600 [Deltaproteobacteria bacterium]|nr:MAG: hypothetical protein EP330_20600 [Deltaproteobacteria bacterium]
MLTTLLALSLALANPEAPADPSPEDTAAGAVTEAETPEEPAPAEPAGPPTPEELAPWAPAFEGRVTVDSPHYDLEILYFQEKNEEGLAEARKRMAANPDDVVPYWMAARFIYEIGERFERDDTSIDKVAHYQEMVDIAEAGLKLDPKNPHLLFAQGIGHGRLGTTKGVLSSLFRAKTVEQAWVATTKSGMEYAAIGNKEYVPCDAHQALAIFYRLVPDWWIIGVIAGTRGDLQKSVDHGKAAVTCGPKLIRGYKEYGVSQICFGQKKKDEAMVASGLATLKEAQSFTPRSNTDRIDLKHLQMLIDDPDLACEYSRDGQQDLDESKLEK